MTDFMFRDRRVEDMTRDELVEVIDWLIPFYRAYSDPVARKARVNAKMLWFADASAVALAAIEAGAPHA